ncbi:MAG: polymer-forming cytoskeletal protein [Candidatus Buchananbacteria bacterium]|nr:polymer-forming cytoskeletal protein [Candidatus Buchananbacteria bacterium]
MFKNQDEIREIETIIGPSVQVEGDFIAAGDMVIEGTVSGKITTEKNLRIGPGAKIFASISAANASIAGEVQGNIKVKENLEIAETARIFGDVKTGTISIAQGATLNGRCQAGDDKKSKFEKIDHHSKPTEKEAPITEELEEVVDEQLN